MKSGYRPSLQLSALAAQRYVFQYSHLPLMLYILSVYVVKHVMKMRFIGRGAWLTSQWLTGGECFEKIKYIDHASSHLGFSALDQHSMKITQAVDITPHLVISRPGAGVDFSSEVLIGHKLIPIGCRVIVSIQTCVLSPQDPRERLSRRNDRISSRWTSSNISDVGKHTSNAFHP